MSNVLSQHKREMVVALGRLGWSLRRIEAETGVRRETASRYLKAAGVLTRAKAATNPPPDSDGKSEPQAAASTAVESKPATNLPPDSGLPKAATNPPPDSVGSSKAATNLPPDSGGTACGAVERLGTANAAAAPLGSAGPPAPPPLPAPSLPTAQRPGPPSACAPHGEWIASQLGLGRNGKAIWQELVDEHGFSADYDSVKRYVRRLRETGSSRDAHPVITTEPGEEAQVDYGTGPMARDPKSGEYRRTRLFVLTLGFSRKSVRLLTWRSSTETWARLHEQAFRRLGGAARVVVLDNLREGVLEPDIYDPELNPLYRDVLKHYGAVAMPCRAFHPDRKGKVESGVGHAKRTPLKGKRFESIEEAQEFLDHWEERWADTRIHGTTKRQVAVAFEEERPKLEPLPLEPFRYYRYGTRTVHLDGCVEVERAYYGVPPGRIGQDLSVQWNEEFVRIVEPRTGELLVEHDRERPGRFRIREEHRPPSTQPSISQLLARGRTAGLHIGTICEAIHGKERELGARKILGLLALAKKHGPAAVDAACKEALEIGVPTYRFVRTLVQRRDLPLSLKQVDPLIRQLTQYRDLIAQKTGDNDE